MAVPEGERRPCKMDVFMHELDLVTYTLQITRNTLQAGEWSTTQRKRKCSALKRALHSWDSSIG